MRSRPAPIVTPLAVLALAAALSSPAHASELRFSITAKGGVVSTGNTLGLAKQLDLNGPGTSDSIGTFLSVDPQAMDLFPDNPGNPWGPGTTSDWTLDGSSAVLELPQSSTGVEVLYAELVWGGSYFYGSENVSADLDSSITLAVEGASVDVAPDPQTGVTLAEIAQGGFAVNYYMRSADVTTFVETHQSDTYTVTGVPATQDFLINQLNAAGWTLVVVYRSADAPTRNLTVFVGGQFVDEDSVEDYPVSGFCTPPRGTVEGGAVISALEGDANRTGDTFQIAPGVNGPFASLSGPNNPVDNFFASQINGTDGALDTLGTAGDLNHDAFAGVNVSGGRQGWDVTKLGLSSMQNQLSAGQTEAVLRAVTTGDSFMPVLAAFEIDVSSPDFEGGTGVDVQPASIGLGQQATVTISVQNGGEVTATKLELRAPLEPGLELISFAIDGTEGDINQQPVDNADLISGVAIGDVAAGAGRELTLVVEASDAPPSPEGWLIVSNWTYDYISCVGEDPLTEQSFAFAEVGFDADGGDGDGDGDGDSGDGDGDGSGDGGSDGNTDGDTGLDGFDTAGFDRGGDDDGCNCQSSERSPAGGLFGLLALLGLLRRRTER